jgi:lysophospholipase L1-like esterase
MIVYKDVLSFIMGHKIITVFLAIIVVIALLGLADFLIIIYGGTPVPAPEIPRGPSTIGNGPPLKYVVMGDSTSIGQGTTYEHSVPLLSAQHLSRNHTVTFINVGISGARASDILGKQLTVAKQFTPDVVLLAVGANDVTHLTNPNAVAQSIRQIAEGLKKANPKVTIVLTGSPAMGSVPRFPFPIKQIMGSRTKQMNKSIQTVIDSEQLTLAPIADRTGAAFLHNPKLFAADKFHPTSAGYALWVPVVNQALDTALSD